MSAPVEVPMLGFSTLGGHYRIHLGLPSLGSSKIHSSSAWETSYVRRDGSSSCICLTSKSSKLDLTVRPFHELLERPSSFPDHQPLFAKGPAPKTSQSWPGGTDCRHGGTLRPGSSLRRDSPSWARVLTAPAQIPALCCLKVSGSL